MDSVSTQTISVKQLEKGLASYVSAVENGREIIVTSHGRAIAKISPVERPRRVLGILKGKIGPQSAEAWCFPDDLIDLMEGKAGS